jgi:serine/threonine-protein kinase
VQRLKNAIPAYENIRHPNLIQLIDHYEIDGGYAAAFEWAEGECLHAHWDFDKYPKYKHPQSPNYKFRELNLKDKLNCIDTIFNFHEEVAKSDYVAIDFYDGSIMYDFENHITTICDIDFYTKMPYINTMGKMWGSSRFMSPEEYELEAIIDEISNVYTMGALAFELLGNNHQRTQENWIASSDLFRIATKATNRNRDLRYQSISDFYKEWKVASKFTSES